MKAFTLIELMVVMVIIGVVASITVPALKGLGQANRSTAAYRQVLDDVGLARLRALSDRSPVYIVFAPTNTAYAFARPSTAANNPRALAERRQLTNLVVNQLSAYALVAERTVGDQPGRHTRRYITEWKTLPEGLIFAPYKLMGNFPNASDEYARTFQTTLPSPTTPLPFPGSRSDAFPLPYLAFNAQGQLMSQRDEIIALAKGSVFVQHDKLGNVVLGATPDVQLNPPVNPRLRAATQTNTYQFVRVNWLTGRAQVELPKF